MFMRLLLVVLSNKNLQALFW